MIRVIGMGAGGHAKVVLDILQVTGDCELVGLLDASRLLWEKTIMGVPVLGGDEMLAELRGQDVTHAFIGVSSTGDTRPRQQLYKRLHQYGFELVNAVHPRAIIADSVRMRQGVTIMAGCVVNVHARLGANVVINTGSIIEHDCVIGDHAFIGPGARLGGTVEIDTGAHIGIGATLLQNLRIGKNAVVGAGAVVLEDVPDNTVVVGVPARVIKRTGA
jgi:UDP-perosamine 4-acetyltransferase